ncbi:MAG: hypothetical protein ACRC92_25925 [Peptostreptococcaceae bacterium]
MDLLSRRFTVLVESERYTHISDEHVSALVKGSGDIAVRMDNDEEFTPTQIMNELCRVADVSIGDMPRKEAVSVVYDPNAVVNKFKNNVLVDIVNSYGGVDIKGNIETFKIDKDFEYYEEEKLFNGYNEDCYQESNFEIIEKREYEVVANIDVNKDITTNVETIMSALPDAKLFHHGMLSSIELEGVEGDAFANSHFVQIMFDGSEDNFPLNGNITAEGVYNDKTIMTTFDAEFTIGSSTDRFDCK